MLEGLGLTLWAMGGSGVAFGRTQGDGYVQVSTEDLTVPESMESPVIVGWYSNDLNEELPRRTVDTTVAKLAGVLS